MKHINPMSTLEHVEKTVDMAYEMAKHGMIDSAIKTVENAHDMYTNNSSTKAEENIVRFIVLTGCHSYTI